MDSYIYSKQWRWGLFAFYLSLTIFDGLTTSGTLRVVLVGFMAFLTGHEITFATQVYSWKKLADGWRDLYHKSNAWRYN